MSTLSERTSKARAAALFSKVMSTDSVQRVSKVLTPGSDAKQYEVIIRRNGHITCECLHSTLGGSALHCDGARVAVCYHALAALIVAAEHAHKCVSFCATEQAALRLARAGGQVHQVDSHQHNETHYHPVWMVVRECAVNAAPKQSKTSAPVTTAAPAPTPVPEQYTQQEWIRAEEIAAQELSGALERRAEQENEYILDGSDDRPAAINDADFDPAKYLASARAELAATRARGAMSSAQHLALFGAE